MKQEILKQVDDIVATIQNSQEYQDYQFLFEKLKNHERANTLIKKVKSLQKEMVKKEIKKEDTQVLETQIHTYIKELESIPLYVEFVEKQEELNRIYQMIKFELEEYFYKKLN